MNASVRAGAARALCAALDCTGNDVLVFRCTQKLLTRLGEKAMEPPARSTTQLGDWYINLVTTRKHRLLLFVSETIVLPVVIKVSELVTIVPRFRAALAEQLGAAWPWRRGDRPRGRR